MAPARDYAVVDAPSGYYRTIRAAGAERAIHTPAAQRAPAGALLLADSEDGERGEVVAERDSRGEWVLR